MERKTRKYAIVFCHWSKAYDDLPNTNYNKKWPQKRGIVLFENLYSCARYLRALNEDENIASRYATQLTVDQICKKYQLSAVLVVLSQLQNPLNNPSSEWKSNRNFFGILEASLLKFSALRTSVGLPDALDTLLHMNKAIVEASQGTAIMVSAAPKSASLYKPVPCLYWLRLHRVRKTLVYCPTSLLDIK